MIFHCFCYILWSRPCIKQIFLSSSLASSKSDNHYNCYVIKRFKDYLEIIESLLIIAEIA